MKKFYMILLALTVVLSTGLTCVFAATYTKFSSKFIKNFRDCDRYEETITSEFEGKTFTTNRKILGWKNGLCKYQETITAPESKYQLDCLLTNVQVEDLYNSMKSRAKETETYELETFAEQTDTATGKTKYVSRGTTTIKGNKAYITWAKYQNNPYFCKPQKLSK